MHSTFSPSFKQPSSTFLRKQPETPLSHSPTHSTTRSSPLPPSRAVARASHAVAPKSKSPTNGLIIEATELPTHKVTRSKITLDEIILRLDPLLKKTRTTTREVVIDGVSPEAYQELQNEAQRLQLPEWDRLRVDFAGDRLIVKYPTIGHEILQTLFICLGAGEKPDGPNAGLDNLMWGGSADVKLEDGSKSPDYSIFDISQENDELSKALPTVVFEVGYTESASKLAQDCARYVACSLGRVLLAIGIKIEHHSRRPGEPRKLKMVTCTFWELQSIEELNDLGDEDLSTIVRSDGVLDGVATRYYCISKLAGQLIKYNVEAGPTYQIFPESEGMKTINILHRHLYRNPRDEDAEKPAYAIPVSTFRKVILIHENQQSQVDRMAKRPLDTNEEQKLLEASRKLKRARS